MNQPRLRELKVGESFKGFYLVKSKRVKQTREGSNFIDLDLQDGSGSLNAKLWNDFEKYNAEFERGDVVKIEGVIEQYKDQPQIKIKRLRKSLPEDPVEVSALQAVTREDVSRMLSEVQSILAEIKNPHLIKLVEQFFQDPALLEKLKQAPAARNLHHAYLGGLLEHIWHMLKIAQALVQKVYPGLDYDLVMAGTFCHDLGKMDELESFPAPAITRAGYLEGHIILGLKLLDEKISRIPNFPTELRLHLAHIILSHHGEHEWGSPVLPSTPEAMLIHHIDNLDAKLTMVSEAIESDQNQAEEFTGYHQILERHLYKRRPGQKGGREE